MQVASPSKVTPTKISYLSSIQKKSRKGAVPIFNTSSPGKKGSNQGYFDSRGSIFKDKSVSLRIAQEGTQQRFGNSSRRKESPTCENITLRDGKHMDFSFSF